MPKKVQRVKDSEGKKKRISEKLKQKANNPKDLTLREFIFSLKDQINEVIDAGYEYSDVASIIKAEGIKVSESTIRSYLGSKKENKATLSKKKNHQATEEEISNNDLTGDSTTINDVIEEEISKTDDSDSTLTL